MNNAFSWYPNEQCCLQAKPKFPLFCSETITIHKPDLIYIVCCKCSKTLKHLQLSLDISAHEEFIITLFSGKPHAVQYLKIQTFSQTSTLLINCILIKYCFVEFYKWIGIVWATLQNKKNEVVKQWINKPSAAQNLG